MKRAHAYALPENKMVGRRNQTDAGGGREGGREDKSIKIRTLGRSHKNFLLASCSALFSASSLASSWPSAAPAAAAMRLGPRKGRRGEEEAEQGRWGWSPLVPNAEAPTTPRTKAGWRRR